MRCLQLLKKIINKQNIYKMTTTTNGQNTPSTEQKNTDTPAAPNNGQVAVIQEKTIADNVLNKIKVFEETGTLNIPKDYSAPNALRAAWLILQETKTADKKPVLQACTKESIANALLRMIILGLNPVKRQCSFIAYGNQLTCQREYNGAIAIAKRDAGVVKVTGAAVFKDDEFAYDIDPETLKKKITKHTQTLESMSTGVVKGAYAIKIYADGNREVEIMSMPQIVQAWKQGPTKGESPAHKNFPDQMAIKTVINRALKIDINSSDDSAFFEDELQGDDLKLANVKHRIGENANKTEMKMDDDTVNETDNGGGAPGDQVDDKKEPVEETETTTTETNKPPF